jgi:hypothetical protein
VTARDESERIVGPPRVRGVEAVTGDPQSLPFAGGSLDVVVPAWTAARLRRAACARRDRPRCSPGGRLAGAANGRNHLRELYGLVGSERRVSTFDAEAAPALVGCFFTSARVEEAGGRIHSRDRTAAAARVDARRGLGLNGVPTEVDEPLSVTRSAVVVVAEPAA